MCYYICKYIFIIFSLFLFHTIDVFSDEEVMINDNIERVQNDKKKLSDFLYHKNESFEDVQYRLRETSSLANDFFGYIIDNFSFGDLAPWCYKNYKDYFRGKKYNFDMEKYNNAIKKSVENVNMLRVSELFDNYNINATVQDSLYYDLQQTNSDLRLFDENGGLVECLLGEENKDNLVLRYLLSQAIMNATSNQNFSDIHELLKLLVQDGDVFDNIYKVFLDLTRASNLFSLLKGDNMFNSFGLPADVCKSLFYYSSAYNSSFGNESITKKNNTYYDDDEMKWYTDIIEFSDHDIRRNRIECLKVLRYIDIMRFLGYGIVHKYFLMIPIFGAIGAILIKYVLPDAWISDDKKLLLAYLFFLICAAIWVLNLFYNIISGFLNMCVRFLKILLMPFYWFGRLIGFYFFRSIVHIILFFVLFMFIIPALGLLSAYVRGGESENEEQSKNWLLKCFDGYPEWLYQPMVILSLFPIVVLFWYIIIAFVSYSDYGLDPIAKVSRFYDCIYHDVFLLSLLDGMCKRKIAIASFIDNINTFLQICNKNPSLKKLTEKFTYDKNFMLTFEYYKKRLYSNIKYEYDEDHISQDMNKDFALLKSLVYEKLGNNKKVDINSHMKNMFLYLDKCQDFDIEKDVYKYSMNEINEILKDYVEFFYHYRSCYQFFKSAIKDIYNIGIYLYAVNLVKNRNFCLAEINTNSKRDILNLEIQDSKNVFLGEKCIANNIVFNDDCQNVLFHGLNGSGKTIFLSQAILNVILAQSLGIAYAKSYKGDCIHKVITNFNVDTKLSVDNSKFMQEILNMDAIYNYTCSSVKGKKILFALDEICSGADPASGELIVKQFYVALMKLGCNIIAATHYSAPSDIENEYLNLHCCNYMFDIEVDDKTGEIIYKRTITRGVPKYSLAGAVVKNMYLQKRISRKFFDTIDLQKKFFLKKTILTDIIYNI